MANKAAPPPVFDLHCHPSLKYSILVDDTFHNKHSAPPTGVVGFINPLGVYYDAPNAKEGGVRVFVNFHYVPENGFRNSVLLNILQGLGVTDIIEEADKFDSKKRLKENSSAWDKLQKSIDRLDYLVKEANQAMPDMEIEILSDPCGLDKALSPGALSAKYQLLILQAIEGAHHLGRYLPGWEKDDPTHYLDRLADLNQRGFCVFTLSHFFLNDICDSAGGIPDSDLFVTAYKIPVARTAGLTKIGKAVVEWSLRNNILIDLVHSTFETRQGVYQLNRKLVSDGALPKLKPLAFTHTGVRDIYRTGSDATFESLDYLPDALDMEAIAECNGIMGLILMKCWLNGEDNDDPLDKQVLIDTISAIRRGTGGTYDHIGLGTDFDGFTHVPDNLNGCAKLKLLSQWLVDEYGQTAAAKILFGNAQRVIKECCCSGRSFASRRRSKTL